MKSDIIKVMKKADEQIGYDLNEQDTTQSCAICS